MSRIQHERLKVRRPCVAWLRTMRAYNQLKRYQSVYVSCPPDLGKQTPKAIASFVADGYESGVYDMTIVAANPGVVKVWLIEFKWGTNNYTKEQSQVAASFSNTPVTTVKIYSVEEFQKFITENL